MNTVFLLMARYDAQVVIPIDVVCRDFFAPLKLHNLIRKISAGDVALPLIRMEPSSSKTAKGVHIQDLANFIDTRHAAAVKECEQLCGIRRT